MPDYVSRLWYVLRAFLHAIPCILGRKHRLALVCRVFL